jgi:hypothetical protein
MAPREVPVPKKFSRDKEREQRWRQIIRRQEQSGGSIAEFCLRENLKPSHFYWWRKEILVRDGQVDPARPAETSKRIEFLGWLVLACLLTSPSASSVIICR